MQVESTEGENGYKLCLTPGEYEQLVEHADERSWRHDATVLLVAPAAVGYEVSGATDGALYAATGMIGALVAGLRVLMTLFGGPSSAITNEASSAE